MRELFDLFFMRSNTDAPIGLKGYQTDHALEESISQDIEDSEAALKWLNFASDSY